jgi:hypothetical protein
MKTNKYWTDGLSVRVHNILNNIDGYQPWGDIKCREDVIRLLGKGDYETYKTSPLRRARNFGWKCWQELCVWCGMKRPEKPVLKPFSPRGVNIVDQAEHAFWMHYKDNQKAIDGLTGGHSEIFIGMKALWKLSWIRKQDGRLTKNTAFLDEIEKALGPMPKNGSKH